MFKFIAPILACLGAVVSSPAPDSQGGQVAGPPEFRITSFQMIGSGCPANTAKYTLNADNTAVTVAFSDFIAQVGPGIDIKENRKNCQMTFGVHVPPGFSFGITNVDYRGFYKIQDQVTANQHTLYYFQGNLNQATCDAPTVVGPKSDHYTNRCAFALGPSLVLCPCGADTVLNINTDVSVDNANNPAGRGVIDRDSNDVSLITIINLQWQQC